MAKPYSKKQQLGKNKNKTTKKSGPKLISLTKLDDLVWRICSLAIRLQDSDADGYIQCCTCNKRLYYYNNGVDCGHFLSRRHKATKFLRKNLHSQCAGCNKYGSGEQYIFGLFVDRVYGEGTAQELLSLSNSSLKLTRDDYKQYLFDYTKILMKESISRRLFEWKEGIPIYIRELLVDIYKDKIKPEDEIIIKNERIP